MSILIVDDEKEIADLVEVILKNEGYEVLKFYDSRLAAIYLSDYYVNCPGGGCGQNYRAYHRGR